MVAYVFDKILRDGAVNAPDRMLAARNWYRNAARSVTTNPDRLIRSDRARFRNKPTIGEMYLFGYDPKHKATLPYYDRFPLVIPFESTKKTGLVTGTDGFHGMNLHYLPLRLRARLMDELYKTTSDQDPRKRMQISYNILKSASRYRFFKPCIKHYLYSHVRTKYFYIEPKEWDIALFLPLQRFVKAKEVTVWKDSIQAIGQK